MGKKYPICKSDLKQYNSKEVPIRPISSGTGYEHTKTYLKCQNPDCDYYEFPQNTTP